MLTKIRTTWHPSKWRDSLKTDIQQVRGSSKLTSSKACSDHLPPFDQLTNMPIYFILKPLPLNLSCAQFYVVWNTLATGKAFHLIGINMMIKKTLRRISNSQIYGSAQLNSDQPSSPRQSTLSLCICYLVREVSAWGFEDLIRIIFGFRSFTVYKWYSSKNVYWMQIRIIFLKRFPTNMNMSNIRQKISKNTNIIWSENITKYKYKW